ncbi:MAG: flagellar filament capping protein FliD [Hydrogenophilus sp.]|nr:flagellar filament capping protein FliD [Hydrogenophilus sp.]
MALTATGIGSGLDIKGLVSQIMSVERQPLKRLDAQKQNLNNQISGFGQIKSAVSQLQSALEALKNKDTFTAVKTTVAQGADFTASAKAGAAVGQYEISVQQLAQAQRVATSATTQFDPSGGGDLTITVGSNSTTINVAAGTTIEQLRDQINAANAGVTASVINNGGVKQLVLTGKETGAANTFTLTGTGALSSLTFSNPNALPTGSNNALYRLQSAQDAQLTINGVQITRSKNTITDAIDNVTLTLTGASNTPKSLTLERDLTPAKNAIQNLANAYNALMDKIDQLGGYDAEKKRAGDLYGDASLRGLRNQVRQVLSQTITGVGDYQRLSDFGVEFSSTGRMTIKESKLTQALTANGADIATFFAGVGNTEGLSAKGIALTEGYTKTNGLIDMRVKGLQQSVKLLDAQKEAFEDRLARLQEMYLRQFNTMDSLLGRMNATGAYLSQQLTNLNR